MRVSNQRTSNEHPTNTDNKVKTVNKVNKTFVPPSLQEFSKYFIENGFSHELAERAFKGYESANWHDSKGKPIKNWMQKCQFIWFRSENKQKTTGAPQSQTQNEIKGW
jgi:hypothetical protein